ncbi:MAG: MATE family efflux transporter [Alphaproteobacteria bacterium]|nr:MATE family efflux transporter [Alphaproteobacteria bacterium]
MTSLTAALRELPPLLHLAIPLVIGLSATTLLGVTDTLFLAPLGEAPLAAVALTSSVAMIFYASIYGALSVVGVNVAHAFGAGDTRAIAREVRTGLAFALRLGGGGAIAMALALFLLPHIGQPVAVLEILPAYWLCIAALLIPFALLIVLKSLFDAIGRPWMGVAFSFLGVALNVPLNAVLIYGLGPVPALGLLGAGIASFIAEACAFAAGFLYWRHARGLRRMRVRAQVTPRDLAALARDGGPLGLMFAAETGASALAGLMLGWFGATALAANQIVSSVSGLLYMLPLGMAAAVAIRIGQAQGAGEVARLRPIGVAALVAVSAWTLSATALLLVAGGAIAERIAPTAEAAALASTLFVIVAAMQVMDGLQSTSLGALRGLRDTTFPAIVSIAVYWGVALPAAYGAALALDLGPVGVWAGFGAGLAIAAAALTVRFLARTRAAAASAGAAAGA